VEALTRLGGEATIAEVAAAIEQLYPGRWKDVSVTMADLTFPGSASSGYPPERRVLERVAPGRYRLRSR
jgi:hypothetical protein